jgi:hypothetical protein
MKANRSWLKQMAELGFLFMTGPSMSAVAGFLGFGGASWKEEVLLHDGKKLIVERSQARGGRHEIGQDVPVAKHTVSFLLPGKDKPITWESEFGLEIEKSSLSLLAIDVVGGIPYIVTTPTGCIAYNKWGRPNPPYVFFKFDGNAWQRVLLTEFPKEVKIANVAIGALTLREEKMLTGHSGPVPAEQVKSMNAESKNPDVRYLTMFVREPIKGSPTACEELVYYKGAWVGPGDSIGKRMMDRKSKQSSSDKASADNKGGR